MEDLVDGVGHDLNNALAVITGYAHILCDSLAGQDELADMADQIRQAAELAASAVARLQNAHSR